MTNIKELIKNNVAFSSRHIGPRVSDQKAMLSTVGMGDIDKLCDTAVPNSIQMKTELKIGKAYTEEQALAQLKEYASLNQAFKTWIGMGYYGTYTPSVIKRNILENPGWYTQYTPYQAEISQGRLEALLNFQTMTSDLTGLPISNASLLDESTAASEAMAVAHHTKNKDGSKAFFVDENTHPQTIDVLKTRANAINIDVIIGDFKTYKFEHPVFGVLLQYPASDGIIEDYTSFIEEAHKQGSLVIMAADLLSLCLLKSPGELGADIAVGTTQRFGVPLGYGGPHAGYFCTTESLKRKIPGRIIGVSKDTRGRKAYRLALQTREQHIRREKATSNICTAQALLANMAGMYAVYHGPEGLKNIASRVHAFTSLLKTGLEEMSYKIKEGNFFDTIKVELSETETKKIIDKALDHKINFRSFKNGGVGISLDETTSLDDISSILAVFAKDKTLNTDDLIGKSRWSIEGKFLRKDKILTQEVFSRYHSESEMMRYLKKLEIKDLSLTTSMIPLGSCTMKLNAASELYPVSWPEFNSIHPFVPLEQTKGYQKLFNELESMLCEVTGYDGISLQPNSGAQGEFSGLLVIKAYHKKNNESHRNICLIPSSAHGTNPASAAMAGLKVVIVKCDENGNIDIADLKEKAKLYKENLAALMVTYPSTHGVFEESITDICDIIHENGGQVYLDGANLNAQLGLSQPGKFGADVSHLNLHKTFAIPHGGGGPGVGPIGVKSHLAEFLPNHSIVSMGGNKGIGAISESPWGSASILPVSWMYMKMMGSRGLKEATQVAILNANYISKRLSEHYDILYKGNEGLVAHECIVDLRDLKKSAKIEVDDIAKRLIDYGFHAPTVSFPVAGTMMIEPTESESKEEIDRFCDAMISIRNEIKEIEDKKVDVINNVLKNAPHTAEDILSSDWDRPYSREVAAFPVDGLKEHKFWAPVSRIDNAFGDRHLVCTCAPIESYEG